MGTRQGYLINDTARNMKKEIKFGRLSALLTSHSGRAILTIDTSDLLTELADAIDEVQDIEVVSVGLNDSYSYIRMKYDARPMVFLEAVADAIEFVFNSDITISDATAKIVV